MEEKVEFQNGVTNDIKSFKDIDNFDELDFNKIDLVRGLIPHNIKEKCLKICQNYLSGVWNQQTEDTIDVKRVSGGLTNQLFCCSIINECEDEEGVPQEVAIRLYGPKYFDTCDNGNNERLSDAIIGLMVSENNLGPKIYGIFEDGQLQKFYKHRQFKNEEQRNPKLSTELMKRLARIHAMDVPIKKNTQWLYKYLIESISIASQKFDLQKEMDEYNCETLKNNDLRKEINWMENVIKENNCQITFTHNDFRSSNMMVTEPDDELVVCDFESSHYGYRGHDFGNLMREWNRDCMDFTSVDGLPPKDSLFRPLFEVYVEESKRIIGESYSQNPFNSVDNLIKEGKIFLLNGCLFGTSFLLKNDESNDEFPLNRKLSMCFAENSFKNFFTLKRILIEQKVIK